MKEQLELKHLAPYLPYGLNIFYWNGNAKEYVEILRLLHYENRHVLGSDKHKPILRPLSDLTKEIAHNGEMFVFSDVYLSNTTIKKILGQEYSTFNNFLNDVDYNSIQLVFKYHFDVFGLIDRGLAIDINTL